jgi:hypothetical protein
MKGGDNHKHQGIIKDYFENLHSNKLKKSRRNVEISGYISPSKIEPRGY